MYQALAISSAVASALEIGTYLNVTVTGADNTTRCAEVAVRRSVLLTCPMSHEVLFVESRVADDGFHFEFPSNCLPVANYSRKYDHIV